MDPEAITFIAVGTEADLKKARTGPLTANEKALLRSISASSLDGDLGFENPSLTAYEQGAYRRSIADYLNWYDKVVSEELKRRADAEFSSQPTTTVGAPTKLGPTTQPAKAPFRDPIRGRPQVPVVDAGLFSKIKVPEMPIAKAVAAKLKQNGQQDEESAWAKPVTILMIALALGVVVWAATRD